MDDQAQQGLQTATLAGGCFWCLEAVFKDLRGVEQAISGYMGGASVNPTYREVCSGTTGHAEVVRIVFDPAQISFGDLLDVFFTIHDPTTLNRQGADVGTQYRSAIFYHDPDQHEIAAEKIKEAGKLWGDPIVTEVSAEQTFYAAEDYHQDYFVNNPNQPYCAAVVAPKVAKARQVFRNRLKKVTA